MTPEASYLYSDRVVLDANLHQRATEPAIQRILGQDFFCPLYLHLTRISILQNLIFPFRYVVATHLRVGQKTSDVNDAELPHLEGMVTLSLHKSRSARNNSSCKSRQSLSLLSPSSPSSLPIFQPGPVPLFLFTFWIVYTLARIRQTSPKCDSVLVPGMDSTRTHLVHQQNPPGAWPRGIG